MTFIEVKNLSKHFPIGSKTILGKSKETLKAVNNLSFTIDKGETVGIIGESGSGKSTLGRLLIGLDDPTEGSISYDGKTIDELKSEDRLKFHSQSQMVFQNPFDTFDTRHTIHRIMSEPLKLHKIGKDANERDKILVEALNNGGMTPAETFLNRYPHQLSGGQLQRVSIIRTMLLNPNFLVADEPVSMLDVSVRAEIIKMLQDLTSMKDTTLVFISHDISTTQFIADRLLVMYKGKIVEEGPTKEVIQNPQDDYTKLLLKSVMSIDPREGKRYQRERVAL